MKLIKKLGLKTGPSGKDYYYGLYECPFCNNTFEALTNNVKKGNTKSCGCKQSKLKIDQSIYKAGVYRIINIVNNKCYVGSTVNLYNRRKTHFGKLRLNYSGNINLQADFNIYGIKNFKFEILEFVEKLKNCKTISNFRKLLNKHEQYWIDKIKPEYNVSKIAGSNKGYVHKKEAILKITERSRIPILQYDLNGNFIKEWESAAQVQRELKLSGCRIRECCRKVIPIAHGFIWKNK